MAFEAYIRFSNVDWYQHHKEEIGLYIELMSSFVKRIKDEYWLKDNSEDSNWDYDLRVFLHEDEILLEVSATGSLAYRRDIKMLSEFLYDKTEIKIVDEDEEGIKI